MPPRAQLRLDASTKLTTYDCLGLIRQTAGSTKPGANYAGQGLSLEVTASDAAGMSIAMTDRSRELCSFSAEARDSGGETMVRVGGLDDCVLVKHSVMFVPVGKEIAGFGYYKRFLAAVEAALRAADSAATVTVSIPA